MKREWKETKTIYYSDELNDDFEQTNLKRVDVPENYKYLRKNPIYNFFSNILYYVVAIPILAIGMKIKGIKVVNKKNLKSVKDVGAFFYGNHVSYTDVTKYQTLVAPYRRMNILGFSDTLTIPFVKHIARSLGYLPVPNAGDMKNLVNLTSAIEYYVKTKRQNILIYPEAHIWPYYTKIRNFPSTSFYYPASCQAPVIPTVTVWKKSKAFKKPRQTIIIGKPIFPRESFGLNQNKQYLYEECLKAMQEISNSVEQFEYIKYIKKDS